MSILTTSDPFALILSFLCLSVVLLFVAYPNRYVTTTLRQDLPGPRGSPLVGNLFQAIQWQNRILDWFKDLIDTYGPLSTFTFPPWGRGILINRPEWLAHVKQGDNKTYSRGPIALEIFAEFPGSRAPVASEGQQWRLARKSIFPIFTIKSFTDHVSDAMTDIVPTARCLLRTAGERGIPVDWNDLAGRIAIAIFTTSTMNLKTTILEPDVDCLDQSDEIRDALVFLNHTSGKRLFNPCWRFTEILNGDYFRFRTARRYVRERVETIVRARRAGGLLPNTDIGTHTDFLSVLLKDPAFDDPILIRDILVTLLFAGRDNTQNVLAWALHALMSNPVWMTKMRAEAITMAQTKGLGKMEYSDLADYPIHLAVFYETVRLWPGLPKNARLALADDVLPELPELKLPAVKIEKGEYIFWSDYHIMRSIDVWGLDANEFNPGRHLDTGGRFIKPPAPYFNGFGAGPRLCPAAQLVTYEFVACMSGIVPFFDFTPAKGATPSGKTYQVPKLAEAFTSSLSGPLVVDVHIRDGVEGLL